MSTHVPCSFINTDEFPVRYGENQGYLVQVSKDDVSDWKAPEDVLVLSVVRDVYYKHPDAPENAMLSVKENVVVLRAKKGDENYPKLYMLLMAQEVCKNITVGNRT